VGRWKVTVKAAPKKVSLNVKQLTVGKGEKVQLVATTTKNSVTQLKWKSSQKSIVSVSADGLVTARRKGTATVTVTTHNGRQASVEVADKTCAQVMGELAELGARELLTAMDDMASGRAEWVEQDEALVTYASKVEKAEMLLDPSDPADLNRRRVKASLDAAPARLAVAGKGVRALDACASSLAVDEGMVVVRKGRVTLGCADGSLELLRVKPDGKREMDASAWASGLRGDGMTWKRA
jgi:hypothetical protein